MSNNISYDQMMLVLVNGDDSRSNTLILNTEGEFELIHPSQVNWYYDLNKIVWQHEESFAPFNGYVGASDETGYYKSIFEEAVEYWNSYKKCNKTEHEIYSGLIKNFK